MKTIIGRTIKLTHKVKTENLDTGNVSIPEHEAADIRPRDTVIVEAIKEEDGTTLGTREYTGSDFQSSLVARTKRRHGRVVCKFYTIKY